jgi:glycine/D-amino acid oxidase-like deaminating enzyme
MNKDKFDMIIVGGGVMGSSVAYHLMKHDNSLKITVVEPDPSYEKASTTLSVGNARTQFSLRENILISQYTFEVLKRFENIMATDKFEPNIVYRREGNLFLVNNASRPLAEKAFDLQKRLGCQVEWWSPEKIKQQYPLFDPKEMAGGSFGPMDGHFDPYAFLMGYKNKARSLGATYVKNHVVEVLTSGANVTGVRLASGERLSSECVVNCTGAWAADLARTAGIHLPIKPVNRQVFVLDTTIKPKKPLPLTVLPSGLYFRSETGGLVLLGKSMAEDPVGFDFSWDDKRFMEILWPELAEFVPAFDRLKLIRGWAGLYAVNTLDGNAILGQWPELKGFYLANGFSGHGLQQAPAVGRYISELILGLQPKLDLSCFRPDRVLENKPLSENGLV